MKERLKILHLIDDLQGGGTSEWVKELVRLTDRKRFEPVVAYLVKIPGYNYEEELRALGVPVFYLGFERLSKQVLSVGTVRTRHGMRTFLRRLYALGCLIHLPAIIRLARREGIDVFHTHLHYSFILGALAGRRLGIPVVHQVPQLKAQTRQGASWAFAAYRWLHPWVNLFFTGLSVEELVQAGGVPQEKIRRITGTVDLETVGSISADQNRIVAEFHLQDAFPILLSVGRFVPEKGHALALEVLQLLKADFPKIRLIILGEGWEFEKFKSHVSADGLSEHVVLPGYRRDLGEFYSAAHLYLRTSLIEGYNMASNAAMAYGKPVVGFETGSPSELICSDSNGILVPKADVSAMAQSVCELIRGEAKRNRLGSAGRQLVEQHWDIRKAVRLFEAAYQRLAKGVRS